MGSILNRMIPIESIIDFEEIGPCNIPSNSKEYKVSALFWKKHWGIRDYSLPSESNDTDSQVENVSQPKILNS